MNDPGEVKMAKRRSSGKILAVFLGVAMVGTLWAALRPVPRLQGWRDDLEAAKVEARESGKPLLAYFTADWCGPCRQMKQTTWPDARVKAALEGYVPVQIDVDAHGEVARRFGVDSIPRVLVLDPNENVVAAMSGSKDAESMARWLAAHSR